MEPDRHGVGANHLDRLAQLDEPLVDGESPLLELGGDVPGRDRAEQSVAFAGLGPSSQVDEM